MDALLTVGLVCLTLICAAADEGPSVPLVPTSTMHAMAVKPAGEGTWEMRSTGGDPYVVLERVAPFDHDRLHVLAFDCRAPRGSSGFQIYFGNPFNQYAIASFGPLPASDQWQEVAIDIKAQKPGEWDAKVLDFRLDLGDEDGRLLTVRNLRLRGPTQAEIAAEEARQREAREKLEALQRQIEARLIKPANIKPWEDVIAGTQRFTSGLNTTAVSVVGRELDLANQLREYDGVETSEEIPRPWIVVGEGASPENHSVIRVLNPRGICEVQFLAFPEWVRGGVQVVALKTADGGWNIGAASFRSGGEVPAGIFTRWGNQLASMGLPAPEDTSVSITGGDFIPDEPGWELATAHHRNEETVVVDFWSGDGTLAGTQALRIPHLPPGDLFIGADNPDRPGGKLIVYLRGDNGYFRLDPLSGDQERVEAGLPPNCTGIHRAADGGLVATLQEGELSHILRMKAPGDAARINVGERENLFWFTTGGLFDEVPEGKYVKRSQFAHLRTDFATSAARNPDFARTDPAFWADEDYMKWVRGRVGRYDADPPTCWEPCFTHRWFYGQAGKWMAAMDDETGLPAYTLVDRENEAGTYGEFGETKSFVSGSYAPGVKPIECLYELPLRAFLGELVGAFRNNPEHFVAVEPNHEMEINAESQTTHGDYNPNMIRAFYRYLSDLYGGLEGINRTFGTEFTPDRFDAPRNVGRGHWDAYSLENPYYMVWMRFMNYCIYRVVAGTYREALLAGFPAEAIKCHQIPDHYAISSLTAFSRPAQRVTPIDWNLNAGVGFGFTRYGVWYNQEFNAVQGPHSSGFDNMVIGEYQSLTPDVEAAYRQLQYMRDNGIQFIHCMVWPEGHDQGYNAALGDALKRLVAEDDKPRPGVTGGTGAVRVWNGLEIVSIGTGEERTGLLKSVTPEGKWDGLVYANPFHAHVDVEPLVYSEEGRFGGDPAPLVLGPFPGIDAGNLIDISMSARMDGFRAGALSMRVFHGDNELVGLRQSVTLDQNWREVRFQVRVQVDTDELRVELNSGVPGDASWGMDTVRCKRLVATRQIERTTKLKKGVFAGERHRGGVTFDVMGAPVE